MDRRDILKGGLLAAFLPLVWNRDVSAIEVKDTLAQAPPHDIAGKRYTSPYFKNLGIAQKIQLSINYNLDYMAGLEQDAFYRYIPFPVEAIVNITYQHGEETWSGFNPKNHALERFNMDRFFHAKFEAGSNEFGGSIELDGVKYILSSISTTLANAFPQNNLRTKEFYLKLKIE